MVADLDQPHLLAHDVFADPHQPVAHLADVVQAAIIFVLEITFGSGEPGHLDHGQFGEPGEIGEAHAKKQQGTTWHDSCEFSVPGTRRPNPLAAKAVAGRCVDDGGLVLLTCGAYANTIRWIPPLVVNKSQIDEALAIFEHALDATHA